MAEDYGIEGEVQLYVGKFPIVEGEVVHGSQIGITALSNKLFTRRIYLYRKYYQEYKS